ncbi:MAG: DUF4199 domain-containing protein [Candidatus Kapaibacterium sp.]|nr:DUF4199 domain-containing protein [Candidatus Kapabacteria bacterium]
MINKYLVEFKWSLIFLLVSLAWMLLEKLVGLHDIHIKHHATYTNLFGVVAITMYVLALLDKRKKDYGGEMTWKQGFMTGLIMSVVIAFFAPLNQVITHYIITPDYFVNVRAEAVSTGVMTIDEAVSYFNLKSYMVQSIVGALLMGVVTSAVIAFFLKKKSA